MDEEHSKVQNIMMLEAIKNMILESENRLRKSMDEKMNDLKKSNEEAFMEVDTKLADLKTETIVIKNDLRKGMKEMKGRIENRITELTQRGEAVQNGRKSEDLSASQGNGEIYRIQRILDNVERNNKKRNIIISGLKISGNDREERCETWLLQKLQFLSVTVKVKNTWYIEGATDFTGAELENEEMKREVMENKSKLKEQNFYIGNDLTHTERNHKRELKKIANDMREKEKKKVAERDEFLLIEGEKFGWDGKKLFQLDDWREDRTINADTWRYIKEHDIICLEETWHEKKDRIWIEKKLKDYRCIFGDGSKEHKKGRCSGELILPYKIRYHDRRTTLITRETIANSLKIDQNIWILIFTYMNKMKEENFEIWEQLTEEYKEHNIIIGRDMNARTSDRGGSLELKRHSEDKTINREGKILLEKIEEWEYT
ncbi:hypothetical protein QAD02_004956 [Eretmocerus hayati]|uniref:Uncharacterized protein n=1 Tax=Eretmocerus hayati TaxID=131215 RepID=A0ACC2NRG0_9HYME|nr:hypothetical protein QAD02_004956 [Eretmocerus hayati]